MALLLYYTIVTKYCNVDTSKFNEIFFTYFFYNISFVCLQDMDRSTSPVRQPIACQTCNKRYSNPSSLYRHKVIHTGECKSVCQVCGKILFWAWRLHEHDLTHTSVRPFGCKICDKGFKRKSDLLSHELTEGSVDSSVKRVTNSLLQHQAYLNMI